MGNKKFDKRLMAALRAVLLIAGVVLGSSFALLYLRYATAISVSETLKTVIILSCGAILGLALMLSARPIASLIGAIAKALKVAVATKNPLELVGYALGTAFGVMAAFVLYVVLSAVTSLPQPLIIILTFAAALLCCFVGALICSRWLMHRDSAEQEEENDKENLRPAGYILTRNALAHERAEEIVGKWLGFSGSKIVVLQRSIDGLKAEGRSEEDADALPEKLSLSCGLKIVNYLKNSEEREDILAYAVQKRLAVVTADISESEYYDGKVKTLCLDSL